MSNSAETRTDAIPPDGHEAGQEHQHALKANGVSSAGAVVMAVAGSAPATMKMVAEITSDQPER